MDKPNNVRSSPSPPTSLPLHSVHILKQPINSAQNAFNCLHQRSASVYRNFTQHQNDVAHFKCHVRHLRTVNLEQSVTNIT